MEPREVHVLDKTSVTGLPHSLHEDLGPPLQQEWQGVGKDARKGPGEHILPTGLYQAQLLRNCPLWNSNWKKNGKPKETTI